mmetsp:Transcript_25071/g.83648  ORF Transcript_25071/g.83648 Transcript_25071/m.83648 type:complete len:238 (+) Transcript_25071:556-1269(+)
MCRAPSHRKARAEGGSCASWRRPIWPSFTRGSHTTGPPARAVGSARTSSSAGHRLRRCPASGEPGRPRRGRMPQWRRRRPIRLGMFGCRSRAPGHWSWMARRGRHPRRWPVKVSSSRGSFRPTSSPPWPRPCGAAASAPPRAASRMYWAHAWRGPCSSCTWTTPGRSRRVCLTSGVPSKPVPSQTARPWLSPSPPGAHHGTPTSRRWRVCQQGGAKLMPCSPWCRSCSLSQRPTTCR